MRGRKRQQGSISSAAALVKGRESTKQKEKEARKERAKEKEAREAGREPAAKERQMRRKAGKEKEMCGERKDPAKEKEVMEEGKAKAAAESVCPQFFKVFFPEQSTERLRIPPMFHQHLKEQPTGPVSLRGPSGNRWQAALASESESESEAWCFDQGWKEFATDHSLRPGHFLVFTRDGPSQFSVAVFASSGVIDPAALDARPASTNDAAVKLEEGEGVGVRGDVDAGDTSDSEVSLLPAEEGDGVRGKRTRAITSGGAGASEMSLGPRGEGRGVTGKRARATSDLPADASAAKKHSALAKKAGKRRPRAGASKDVSTIVHNPTFSLLDESKTFNKTQIRDKNVPRSGKFLLRTTKAPVVISQRRLVTEEEKGLALRKAMEFKSKHPFTMQIMIESYVYVGFFMNIACEFVRESLPRTSKRMTLWDPLGKPWDVSYVYYGDRAAGSFGGGWGRFSLGNNLEKSDVCVFELFEEDNMRVHIYRVVPEITPLLRASNKDY